MNARLTEEQLQQLAANLRCPLGDEGLKAAQMMQATNAGLIDKTFAALSLAAGDKLLEIGPGNGSHVARLPSDIDYTGLDISKTMITEAQNTCAHLDNCRFVYYDGKAIPFENQSFNKIATINTIYFWEDPKAYASQIVRVLKPQGILAIGFIPKSTMQHIPFSKYGFRLYDPDEVSILLNQSGLVITGILSDTEFVTTSSGGVVERGIVVLTAVKQ